MDKNYVTGIDNLSGFNVTKNEGYYKVDPNIYNKVK